MKSVIKRSISIDGHKTSITLEDAFWSGLKEIAQAQGTSVPQTVKEIARTRRRTCGMGSIASGTLALSALVKRCFEADGDFCSPINSTGVPFDTADASCKAS